MNTSVKMPTALSHSLSALLKSKALNPKQLFICEDNARLPTEEFVKSMRIKNYSMANFIDFSVTYLDRCADFYLPVWELDASGDSRWDPPVERESLSSAYIANKSLPPAQPGRSSSLPPVLRHLPYEADTPASSAKRQTIDILAETIEMAKEFEPIVASSPSSRSSWRRPQVVRRASLPSKDFSTQCQQLKLVF